MNPLAHPPQSWVPDVSGLKGRQPWLFLDAQDPSKPHGYLAIGVKRSLTLDHPTTKAYTEISDFVGAAAGRCFGWISYDQLSAHPLLDLPDQPNAAVPLPVVHWVEPEGLLAFRGCGPAAELNWMTVPDAEAAWLAEAAIRKPRLSSPQRPKSPIHLGNSSLNRPRYTSAFKKVHAHIHRGDVYELNLCREISGQWHGQWDAAAAFGQLVEATSAPFSAMVSWNHIDILCASPERFLRRQGPRLISQPIKGTAPRHADPQQDKAIAEALRTDKKERAENVMITDLVRNDMSQVALPSSVSVDELCAIYSFRNVHQMVSTVSCDVRPDAGFDDILHAAFPMGSMTGAPKIRAMEITAEVEPVRRGLYSGTLGWAEPNGQGGVGDFDLNVVIRTAMVDPNAARWSVHVGGAITALAEADSEWAETQLKARAVLNALGAEEKNEPSTASHGR